MGGWDTSLDEAEVQQKARSFADEIALDIDLSEAFMPGKQKGILTVPLAPRGGEDRLGLQRRAIQAVELVRKLPNPAGQQTPKAGCQGLVSD